MLKRIYANNYKCLVNFELSLDNLNLFLGNNGSGKSVVFQLLRAIQRFVAGEARIPELFEAGSRTRWLGVGSQTFELEVNSDLGKYKYELEVEHAQHARRVHVNHEHLWFEDKPLLQVKQGDVHLFSDVHAKISEYSFDRTLSALSAIPERKDNAMLTWFKEYFRRLIIIQILPPVMVDESPEENEQPSLHFENFVSWYRHVSQDQGMAIELVKQLREVVTGFDHFRFEAAGEKHRTLMAYFRKEHLNEPEAYRFSELSDGQRMLIALYSLLHYARSSMPKHDLTVCLDEAENFLALPEIQPWLAELYESCSDGNMQALLVSHSPEFINYLLASSVGIWFERQGGLPTRVRRIAAEKDGLEMSELIARGWIGG